MRWGASMIAGLLVVGCASSCALSRSGTAEPAGAIGAPCAAHEDCPDDNECRSWGCVDGACQVLEQLAAGTEVSTGSVLGDCQKRVCDADGAIVSEPAPDDAPDDGDQCTTDLCVDGVATHDKAPDDTPCGSALALSCDDGVCMGCTAAEECPIGTPCREPTCNVATTACGFDEVAPGTEVGNPASDDCLHDVCNADGLVETAGNAADVPPQDQDLCTAEVCTTQGMVEQMPANDGTVCSTGYCYGGACAQCADDTHCPALDPTSCMIAVCNGGSCGQANAPDGEVSKGPVIGDCLVLSCQGGTPQTVAGDDPQPDEDPNDCDTYECDGTDSVEVDESDGTDCDIPGFNGFEICCDGTCEGHVAPICL